MEIIIVIAIIAILAVVAIPSITGYVEAAKETADIQKAAELMDAVAIAYNLNSDIIPAGKQLVIRWDTSSSRNGPGTGKGDVTVEARFSSADREWVSKFEEDLEALMDKSNLGSATSKNGQKDDLLFKFYPETGEFVVHSLYKEEWVDGVGLDLKTENF